MPTEKSREFNYQEFVEQQKLHREAIALSRPGSLLLLNLIIDFNPHGIELPQLGSEIRSLATDDKPEVEWWVDFAALYASDLIGSLPNKIYPRHRAFEIRQQLFPET